MNPDNENPTTNVSQDHTDSIASQKTTQKKIPIWLIVVWPLLVIGCLWVAIVSGPVLSRVAGVFGVIFFGLFAPIAWKKALSRPFIPIDEADEAELERQLGKVGAVSGAASGAIGNAIDGPKIIPIGARVAEGTAIGATAGGYGAKLGASVVGNEVWEETIVLLGSFESVYPVIKSALTDKYKILDSTEPSIRILAHSGFGNLNPAIVHVDFQQNGQQTKVTLKGVSKEGWPKQHAGQKSAQHVGEYINSLQFNTAK